MDYTTEPVTMQTTVESTQAEVESTQTNTENTQLDVETEQTDESKSAERSYKVSFESIDPTGLEYSLSYKCAKSAAGQVVQGLNHLAAYVLGEGEYDGKKKVATNQFQVSLYPNIASLAKAVVAEYTKKFVTDVTDPVQRQVFGANLNGSRNDGQLNKFITCKGVNRFLRYQYSQLGQLLMLLHYRLAFIANRDSLSVKRYQENPEECKHFEDLRGRARDFCDYLKNTTLTQWATFVTEARKFNEENGGTVKSVKLTADNVDKKFNQTEGPSDLSGTRPPRQYQRREYSGHREYADRRERPERREYAGRQERPERREYTGRPERREYADRRPAGQYHQTERVEGTSAGEGTAYVRKPYVKREGSTYVGTNSGERERAPFRRGTNRQQFTYRGRLRVPVTSV